MEKITFKVQRYDPDKDAKPHMQSFTIPSKHGMTVLDGLIYIKENIDNTLAFRSSCRMGICGSCGMLINKLPMLACNTPIEELKKDTIEAKSLPNFPIVKDLVPDLTQLFLKHRSIKPFIIQDMEEIEKTTGEFLQSHEQLEDFVQFAYCVKCGICMAACPTLATDKYFLGPQPLAQAYRYSADKRDCGLKERFKQTDIPHGLWLCHMAGACSDACPKGVDPALAIQLLKRASIPQSLNLTKKKAKPIIAAPLEQKKPKVAPPEFTIKKNNAK